MSNKGKAIATMADLSSHAHTLWSMIKPFFLGHNDGSDANPKKEGVQAHAKGKGRADESLFREAMAEAKREFAIILQKEGLNFVEATAKANRAGAKITQVLSSLSPPVRKEIILDIGLGEQERKEVVDGGTDKNGKKKPQKTIITIDNVRGKKILLSWLYMTKNQIKSEIDATVNGSEHFDYRITQINQHSQEYVDKMRKKYGDLPERESLEDLRKKNGTNPLSTLWKTLRRKK